MMSRKTFNTSVEKVKALSWNISGQIAMALLITIASFAQKKELVHVKTFDQQLTPYRNVELSINGKEYFSIGGKGTAFIELSKR